MTLSETKPDNSYHALATRWHFQALSLGVTFDSTNSQNCFHYSPFQSVLTPRDCLGFVQNFLLGDCVSGVAFVSLLLISIVGDGHARWLLTFTRVRYKFSHSLFVLVMFC